MAFAAAADEGSVVQRKKALRKEIRAKVRELTDAQIVDQSQKVWDRLCDTPFYRSAGTIGLFLSMPRNEIRTDPVLRHALRHGKTVYVPQVGSNFEKSDMDMWKVFAAQPSSDGAVFHESWPKNRWGIPEPPEDMPRELARPGDIDLLVVPGLAFDRHGNRLGQGKGYYDRFIARMKADGHELPLVAVCLSPQLVDTTIPTDTYDQTVTTVVTPDGVIDVDAE